MADRYDVLVVGARCAGASLATLLARDGAKVLLVDAARMPSDQVISTHTIHPVGMDVLDELGVGDAVRSRCQQSRVLRIAQDGHPIDVELPDGRRECCPRRERLDGLLQAAAVEAGAEFQDGCRAQGLLEENGRIVGARLRRDGAEMEVRAKWVVGADGRRSTIAEQVGAEEYLGYQGPRGAYWAYWPAPPAWAEHPDLATFDFYVGQLGAYNRFIFPTDDDHLLLASAFDLREVDRWRANPLSTLTANLRQDPLIAPLLDGNEEPASEVRGTISERYFFRRSAGPGWALVGDAGHHKDPHIGDGISDALLQARDLAKAIDDGSDAAVTRYWRTRDVDYYDLFRFSQEQGMAEPVSALDRLIFAHGGADPAIKQAFPRVVERQLSPFAAFPIAKILSWMGRSVLRGGVNVVPPFLAQGRRMARYQRELGQMRKALAALDGAA